MNRVGGGRLLEQLLKAKADKNNGTFPIAFRTTMVRQPQSLISLNARVARHEVDDAPSNFKNISLPSGTFFSGETRVTQITAPSRILGNTRAFRRGPGGPRRDGLNRASHTLVQRNAASEIFTFPRYVPRSLVPRATAGGGVSTAV